ncbi:MAG: type VI secretion system tip protein TssI/VgrG, partial [Pluralibacter gergoviae]|nr:type VI secretion system tip protein TssI/VgrG [Pluralibacter gergoviae]
IWTDRYGRIKVKFHWDRLAKGDDTSSCWVRVSSAWAGQGFGGVQIPRVGDEVVIDFINGDPDRPLVTGRVYNEASMPPWALPAAATQMGFLSRTKDGSSETANALRFEDKAGEEQVWIQAQKNLDTNVKNDETHSIAKNRTHFVGEDETLRVVQNQNAGVKGEVVCLTGSSRSDKVVNNYTLSAGSTLRLECGESAIELSSDGSVNIVGNKFNFTAKDSAQINTLSGDLHLNPDEGASAISPPGSTHQASIQQEVDGFFTAGSAK